MITGCSKDEAGADTEAGGYADGTASSGASGDVREANGDGDGGGGMRASGGGGAEGTSADKKDERCPQCGILCRNLHVLQLHLEDVHKTSFPLDKTDIGSQFSQVVCFTVDKQCRLFTFTNLVAFNKDQLIILFFFRIVFFRIVVLRKRKKQKVTMVCSSLHACVYLFLPLGN